MLTDAFLSRLDTLALAMRGRAQGGAGGSRRSRQTGSSAEFSDYREYIPGDDIRRLDWNAYARFDKLFLKLFMEEQESQVTILLDASASMEAKWASARSAAEAVGYLALTGGDRLCLHCLKEGKAVRFPQLSGRAAFPRLIGLLDSCVPDGKTDTLTETVKHAEGLKKGLCFLITDGYTEDALKETLDYLRYMRHGAGRRHEADRQRERRAYRPDRGPLRTGCVQGRAERFPEGCARKLLIPGNRLPAAGQR